MKLKILAIFTFCFSAVSSFADCNTADDLVAKHIEYVKTLVHPETISLLVTEQELKKLDKFILDGLCSQEAMEIILVQLMYSAVNDHTLLEDEERLTHIVNIKQELSNKIGLCEAQVNSEPNLTYEP